MADLPGIEVVVSVGNREVLAGRFWSHRRRGTESMTFSYEPSYLSGSGAYQLDPNLPLVSGSQQTPVGWEMFGCLADTAPDRWGRRVIKRAESHRARALGVAERSIGEVDYLLGVRDDLRMGAIRLLDPESNRFLAPDDDGVPPLVELPRLLEAVEAIDRGEDSDDDVALLLHQGSSLGGARPKANVLDAGGNLSIAKFPSPSTDEWDVIAWEHVALTLARRSGIAVSPSALHRVAGRSVLVIRRFDRTGRTRIGYLSAMSILGLNRGEASYLDIAEAIERFSPRASEDLVELWRRMAFTILITNRDDHLRNHGFLRRISAGWELSPAFDLNPDPEPGPRLLKTAISHEANEASVDLLMSVAEWFRLNREKAITVLREVVEGISGWRACAAEAGLSAEIVAMAKAFEHEASTEAANLVGR